MTDDPKYVREFTPAAAPVAVNMGTKVRLESRLPSLSNGSETTTEVWSGARDAIMAMYSDYAKLIGVESLSPSSKGAGMLELTVVWDYSIDSFPDDAANPEVEEDDKPQWSINRIRITSPLAAHPYFQLAYITEAGSSIETHLAAVDFALAHGEVYDPESAAPYTEWVKRYWALRVAGVNSYPDYGVSITKTMRTPNDADIRDAVQKSKKVVGLNDLKAPNAIFNALGQLPRITGYQDADGQPSSNPWDVKINEQGAQWEFYQLPPEFSGPAKGPWELNVEWIGLERWSAVLYPGGTWDPPSVS